MSRPGRAILASLCCLALAACARPWTETTDVTVLFVGQVRTGLGVVLGISDYGARTATILYRESNAEGRFGETVPVVPDWLSISDDDILGFGSQGSVSPNRLSFAVRHVPPPGGQVRTSLLVYVRDASGAWRPEAGSPEPLRGWGRSHLAATPDGRAQLEVWVRTLLGQGYCEPERWDLLDASGAAVPASAPAGVGRFLDFGAYTALFGDGRRLAFVAPGLEAGELRIADDGSVTAQGLGAVGLGQAPIPDADGGYCLFDTARMVAGCGADLAAARSLVDSDRGLHASGIDLPVAARGFVLWALEHRSRLPSDLVAVRIDTTTGEVTRRVVLESAMWAEAIEHRGGLMVVGTAGDGRRVLAAHLAADGRVRDEQIFSLGW